MFAFEMCPMCHGRRNLLIEQVKPMVLCGLDKEMQCDVCNNSFPLRQIERILKLAKQLRNLRYQLIKTPEVGDTIYLSGDGEYSWDGENWVRPVDGEVICNIDMLELLIRNGQEDEAGQYV